MRKTMFFIKLGFYLVGSTFNKMQLTKIKKRGDKNETDKFITSKVSNWAKFVLNHFKVKVNVIGRENIPNENCLFVCNHQSNVDIPTLLAEIEKPMGFVAKKELEKFPGISTWMKEMKCVFIDRENPREGIKAIVEGIKYLKEGHSMIIFPEGTRSKSDKMGEFKKGSMKMAIKAKVPIVPITLDGTYKAYEGNDGKFKGTEVRLIIDKPINVSELNKEEQGNLSNTVRDIIEKNLNG